MLPLSEIDFANTCAWLDALYGQCASDDGSLVIVSPSRNHVIGIHPVGRGADLVGAAKEMHRHSGCYLKINLMDHHAMVDRAAATGKQVVGNRDEVKTIVSFHLDVDAGKDPRYPTRSHALWALSQMPRQPTLVINSGGDQGGFHTYWLLKKPHRIVDADDRRRIQRAANAWKNRLKELCGGRLDSTSNLDRVLRCVGVPRQDGKRVFMESYDPWRLYDITELSLEFAVAKKSA